MERDTPAKGCTVFIMAPLGILLVLGMMFGYPIIMKWREGKFETHEFHGFKRNAEGALRLDFRGKDEYWSKIPPEEREQIEQKAKDYVDDRKKYGTYVNMAVKQIDHDAIENEVRKANGWRPKKSNSEQR